MKTNSVQLIGYVGNDLVARRTSNGSRKVSLRIATSHPVKKQGEEKPIWVTTWHDVVAWDKTAEYAEVNFVKGSHILIDGAIVYRTYLDKLGHTRYVTEIKATSLQNLDR